MSHNHKTLSLLILGGALLASRALAQQPGERLWYEDDRGSAISDEGPRPGAAAAILLYPANRLADLLDILGLQIGTGLGLHVGVQATEAAQVGLGAASGSNLGFEGRTFGMYNESIAQFALLFFNAEHYTRQRAFGGFTSYSTSEDVATMYQGPRDYAALGARASVLFVHVGAQAHPLEVPDAVLGLVGIDLMHDDWPRRSLGNEKTHLTPAEARTIKRIVIVPSRVVGERTVRMEQAEGLGVYYHRHGRERHFGPLGTLFGDGGDGRAREEFNGYLVAKKFDLEREMAERAERILVVRKNWDVVDVGETLVAYSLHSVAKSNRGQKVRRLPNYAGLARHYGADAVLDIRVWEWGVLRTGSADAARMRIDCQYKLIAQPANKVLLDVRVSSDVKEKPGMSLLDFSRNEGDALIRESLDAADVVTAKFADIIVETE